MPSHAVDRVHAVDELGGAEVRVEATLACGCELSIETRADRLIERGDGTLLLVGKYRCPKGHPVGAG